MFTPSANSLDVELELDKGDEKHYKKRWPVGMVQCIVVQWDRAKHPSGEAQHLHQTHQLEMRLQSLIEVNVVIMTCIHM